MTTVIALGGNALMRPGERGTAAEQLANLRGALPALAPLLGDRRVVVTHGNGPQVGNELVRHERAADEVPPLPLYVAVAQTQAEIGALIATELRPIARGGLACVLTHVRVDAEDPAFDRPTKPVGPFYSESQARELERDRGWAVAEDAGRGFRRLVPSPRPVEIVELDSIRALLDNGAVVIACGGGGIPVVARTDALRGVDAVIDKDRSSSLLARGIGAKLLVVVTDVAAVLRDYGTARQEEIRGLTPDEADALVGELPEGSMRPKVEACAEFVRSTRGEALITSADALPDALAGRAGTRISR